MKLTRGKRLSLLAISALLLGACWGGLAALELPVGLLLVGLAATSFAVIRLSDAAFKRLERRTPPAERDEPSPQP